MFEMEVAFASKRLSLSLKPPAMKLPMAFKACNLNLRRLLVDQ